MPPVVVRVGEGMGPLWAVGPVATSRGSEDFAMTNVIAIKHGQFHPRSRMADVMIIDYENRFAMPIV